MAEGVEGADHAERVQHVEVREARVVGAVVQVHAVHLDEGEGEHRGRAPALLAIHCQREMVGRTIEKYAFILQLLDVDFCSSPCLESSVDKSKDATKILPSVV